MITELPMTAGQKHGSNVDYRENLMVNRTIVVSDIKGDQGYHLSHDGLSLHATAEGIDRGAIHNPSILLQGKNHLRVSGNWLVYIKDGVSTKIQAIPGDKQVSMPYSFQTQAVIADGNFYLYDGGTFTKVDDPSVGYPLDAVWVNGLYVFVDGINIYHTKATDEFSFEPNSFATAELSPDKTLGILRVGHNQIAIFDRYSTEWFSDTGGDNFRFRRITGKKVSSGIVGTHCKTELDGRIFTLGNRIDESISIHELGGGQQNTIASREVDKILATYSEDELSKSVLESRVKERDKFLIVRLLRDTLMFNLTVFEKVGINHAWTRLKSDVLGDTPWRGRNGVFVDGQWFYGDSKDGRIGVLDETTNLQYGDKVEEIFYTPIIPLARKSISELEMDTIAGFSAKDVNLMFSISYNGVTHGKEVSFPVSRSKDYSARYILPPLGFVDNQFSMKFRIVADGRTAFSGLRIEHD